jgi:hypothetical protein
MGIIKNFLQQKNKKNPIDELITKQVSKVNEEVNKYIDNNEYLDKWYNDWIESTIEANNNLINIIGQNSDESNDLNKEEDINNIDIGSIIGEETVEEEDTKIIPEENNTEVLSEIEPKEENIENKVTESLEQYTDIFIPLGLSQDDLVQSAINEFLEQDSEFGAEIKEVINKSAEKKAIDFKSNVKDWIKKVYSIGGYPMFVTHYGGQPFINNIVMGRSWGAKGNSIWFKDVPSDIYQGLENHSIKAKEIMNMDISSKT